jgi:hypothetical protein
MPRHPLAAEWQSAGDKATHPATQHACESERDGKDGERAAHRLGGVQLATVARALPSQGALASPSSPVHLPQHLPSCRFHPSPSTPAWGLTHFAHSPTSVRPTPMRAPCCSVQPSPTPHRPAGVKEAGSVAKASSTEHTYTHRLSPLSLSSTHTHPPPGSPSRATP